jgi:hypothetical protein
VDGVQVRLRRRPSRTPANPPASDVANTTAGVRRSVPLSVDSIVAGLSAPRCPICVSVVSVLLVTSRANVEVVATADSTLFVLDVLVLDVLVLDVLVLDVLGVFDVLVLDVLGVLDVLEVLGVPVRAGTVDALPAGMVVLVGAAGAAVVVLGCS